MEQLEFEQGEVVWFNPQKRYGFLKDARGSQVFFHFNDGRFPVVKENVATYGEPAVSGFYNNPLSLPDPKAGDFVVFERAKGSKGRSKASPWCYQQMLANAWLDIARYNEPCSVCGHSMGDHTGPGCMVLGCHCGDEAYEDEQEEFTQVWYTEGPGGHNYYE